MPLHQSAPGAGRAALETVDRAAEDEFCYGVAVVAGRSITDTARDATEHFGRPFSRTMVSIRINAERDRRIEERRAHDAEIRDREREDQVAQLDAQRARLTADIMATMPPPSETQKDLAKVLVDHGARARYETALLRNMQRRAALLGLDAPATVEVGVTVNEASAAVLSSLERTRARLAGEQTA